MRKLTYILLGLMAWAWTVLAATPAAAQVPAAAPAMAAAQAISAYDVMLNGRDTGEVLDFFPGEQGLEAWPDDLRRLGIVLKPGAGRTALRSIPGLSFSVNDRTQMIFMTADRQAMRAALISLATEGDNGRFEVSPGAVLNYDLTATNAGGRTEVAGVVDARAFGRAGVLESTTLVATGSGRSARRLDTSWTYADARSLRRYQAGDLVGGALTWTRPVRMAGVQVSSDFALRPDLVTFPTPTLKGDTAAASTVDVFINGEQRYTGPVAGGAFDLASVPVVSGVNQISMVVTDAAGRRTTQVLPFYASPVLLAKGLASYSVEAGALRSGYGGADDRYGAAAASASGRWGVTPAWTMEGHAEATRGLFQAGLGSAFATRFGVLTVAGAASGGGAGRRGAYASAAFERVDPRFSISAGVEASAGQYSDLASTDAQGFPKARLRLQVGWPLDSASSVNAAVVHTVAGPRTAYQNGDAVAVSYSRRLGRAINLSASAYVNAGASRGKSFFLTISAFFGGHSAAVSAVSTDHGPLVIAQAAKPSTGPADPLEWRMAAQAGSQSQLLGEIGARTTRGEFTAGIDRIGRETALRATASGSLVAMDHRVFVSKLIDQSFAVVHVDAPGVPVLSDNRMIGRTSTDGRLLAPDLRPWQANTLALTAADIPFQLSIAKTVLTVKPQDRAGVVVRFDARIVDEALLDLVDGAGKPLALGSLARDASPGGAPVGFDGQAFVTGLKAQNALKVTGPDGTTCIARFDYARAKDRIARIGPVRCLVEPAA